MRDSVGAQGSDRPHLSLVIPAYNEEDRIAGTLKAAEDHLATLGNAGTLPGEIILVDDGSADGTLSAARKYAAGSSVVRIVAYEPNRGKGFAVRQGVLASRGEYVAFSDADLSAPLEEMAKLLEATRKGYDVAIGSRAVRDAAIPVHQPLYRELGGKGLNLLIQALAVPGIHDTQCGFKLFRGALAREVFAKCFIDGWGFDVEVLYLVRRMGCSIAEVGVRWSHAEGSKIRPFRAGLQVLKDILRMRAHNYGRLSGV